MTEAWHCLPLTVADLNHYLMIGRQSDPRQAEPAPQLLWKIVKGTEEVLEIRRFPLVGPRTSRESLSTSMPALRPVLEKTLIEPA
jgi:hypothetical protein